MSEFFIGALRKYINEEPDSKWFAEHEPCEEIEVSASLTNYANDASVYLRFFEFIKEQEIFPKFYKTNTTTYGSEDGLYSFVIFSVDIENETQAILTKMHFPSLNLMNEEMLETILERS